MIDIHQNETIPDEDEYEPFDGLIISPVGTVIFKIENTEMQAGFGRCVRFDGAILNKDGKKYDVHSFKWQHREDNGSPWKDIPDTENDEGICGYLPVDSGQYQAVLDISIGETRHKYASKNIISVL